MPSYKLIEEHSIMTMENMKKEVMKKVQNKLGMTSSILHHAMKQTFHLTDYPQKVVNLVVKVKMENGPIIIPLSTYQKAELMKPEDRAFFVTEGVGFSDALAEANLRLKPNAPIKLVPKLEVEDEAIPYIHRRPIENMFWGIGMWIESGRRIADSDVSDKTYWSTNHSVDSKGVYLVDDGKSHIRAPEGYDWTLDMKHPYMRSFALKLAEVHSESRSLLDMAKRFDEGITSSKLKKLFPDIWEEYVPQEVKARHAKKAGIPRKERRYTIPGEERTLAISAARRAREKLGEKAFFDMRKALSHLRMRSKARGTWNGQ